MTINHKWPYTPNPIRTDNLRFRRPMLYPIEPWVLNGDLFLPSIKTIKALFSFLGRPPNDFFPFFLTSFSCFAVVYFVYHFLFIYHAYFTAQSKNFSDFQTV